jgi:hypothetical protein
MVAVAVAVTAIVLGSGVSAAVTGGRSVNPLDGIQQVVAELTGGRTQEQRAALDEAQKYLDAAREAVKDGNPEKASAELDKIDAKLLSKLTDDDRAVVSKAKATVEKTIGG